MNKAVIIPAVKKNVAFYDDLIKKIAGQSLIERVINKGGEIVEGLGRDPLMAQLSGSRSFLRNYQIIS